MRLREPLDQRGLTVGPSIAWEPKTQSTVTTAHSDDADHRFRQADRRFQAMPITLEERRSIGALGVGVEG